MTMRPLVHSPEFPSGVTWLNARHPLSMREDLRGQVVILDFWTYCCINCHHVLPDLAKLEEKYKNELVVIGVHSPKFFAEAKTENIRQKVREYQIKHPVINDSEQILWNRFGVSSWPTLVLLNVDGSPLGAVSGEGHYAELDRYIGMWVARNKARGDLNTTPLHFEPESDKPDTLIGEHPLESPERSGSNPIDRAEQAPAWLVQAARRGGTLGHRGR